MITLNATSELLRIFQLYKRADKSCMEYLASLYQKHIFEKGIGLWNARQEDVENDPAFIKSVIQFLQYFNGICQKSFENNKLFLLACKEAYISTINFVAGKFTMVEILSVFVDTLQKPQSTAVGSQKLTEPEIENLLYETISIFSHLKAKDVYVELYRVHLSRRLLNSRSASYEMEMNYVSKLKINCGAQFTSKLEGMLFDLDLSDDKEIINELIGPSEVKLTVKVLSAGCWPRNNPLTNILLPPPMASLNSFYNNYYVTKHNGSRKLEFILSLGTVEIKCTSRNKVYDLTVATVQAIVIMFFNDHGANGEIIFDFQKLRNKPRLRTMFWKEHYTPWPIPK